MEEITIIPAQALSLDLGSDQSILLGDSLQLNVIMILQVVNMASTEHSANGYVYCQRRVKGPDGGWREIQVRKPLVVDDYNQRMNGVDKSDQLLQPYCCLRKVVRYMHFCLLWMLYIMLGVMCRG